MIMRLYSLKDRLNGFTPPIPFAMDEVAQRWFKEMISENTTVRLSPDDFSLWYMGEFNTDTGEITDNENRKEVVYNGEI